MTWVWAALIGIAAPFAVAAVLGALYVLGWVLLFALVSVGIVIGNTIKRFRRPVPIPELAVMRREGVPPQVWVQGPQAVEKWKAGQR